MGKAGTIRIALLLFAAIFFATFAPVAAAQAYPSKALEFVVHTSPGGGTDVFARAISEMLQREKLIAQPILANRVGGGGTIAFSHIKGKRGDPHVVLTVATGSLLAAAARTELGLGLDNYTLLSFFSMDPQVMASGYGDGPY